MDLAINVNRKSDIWERGRAGDIVRRMILENLQRVLFINWYIFISFFLNSKTKKNRSPNKYRILSSVRDSLIILVSPIVYERAMRTNRLLYVIFIF